MILTNLRRTIAEWIFPEMFEKYHAIMGEISDHRAWLSEFPEIWDTMTRILECHAYRFSKEERPMPEFAGSLWEFREYLRRKKKA